MDDLTAARLARKSAVAAEFLALKARRALAEQSTASIDDWMLALRSAHDAIVGIYCEIQAQSK